MLIKWHRNRLIYAANNSIMNYIRNHVTVHGREPGYEIAFAFRSVFKLLSTGGTRDRAEGLGESDITL
jgi:hypothetical protein